MKNNQQNSVSVIANSGGNAYLDIETFGGQSGDLIVLAARPSMGKTTLSLRFAVATFEKIIAGGKNEPVFGKTVQYFSLEEPAEKILQRLASMQSQSELSKIQSAELNDEEADSVSDMHSQWQNRLLIDDSPSLTPQMLKAKVQHNANQYGKPAMIIVDYIQLMSEPDYQDNRKLEISAISRELKALAKEMDCPVIVLSQLNRNLEQRENKRPILLDLQESGSLAQDANLLLFIYRDEVYNDVEPNKQGITEIIIAKSRDE